MIKMIIFDWDDVFTTGAWQGYFKCYSETLSELGVKLDPKEQKRRIVKRWGQPYREELRELLKESPDLLDKACDVFTRHQSGKTFYSNLKLVPGTAELLNRLRDKYLLVVATGSHPKKIHKQIKMFKIPNVFSQIVSGHDIDDAAQAKPHPLMVEMILKKQRVDPREAVLVGDAKNDVLMARNANVLPIVVLTGHLGRQEAEKLEVEHIIEDVTKLEQVLKKI